MATMNRALQEHARGKSLTTGTGRGYGGVGSRDVQAKLRDANAGRLIQAAAGIYSDPAIRW